MSDYCRGSHGGRGSCDSKILGTNGLAQPEYMAPICKAMVLPPAAQWTESTLKMVQVPFNPSAAEDNMHQGLLSCSFALAFRYIICLIDVCRWNAYGWQS